MKKFFEALKEGVGYLVNVLIPREKDEKFVFVAVFSLLAIVSVLLYASDSIYSIIFESSPIMGFDVRLYLLKFSSVLYMTPFTDIVHPLLSGIMLPITILNRLLFIFFGYRSLMLFCSLEFNFICACSMLVIYKYCRSLLGLNKQISLTIVILFLVHAYVMILSFIPESYPLSMLFLLLLVYVTTDNILNGKKIPFSSNVILFCLVTGTTISNGLKVVYADLFQRGTFGERVKTVFNSGITCLLVIIVSFILTYFMLFCLNPLSENKREDLLNRTVTEWLVPYSKYKSYHMTEHFFSEPILFHSDVTYNPNPEPGSDAVMLRYTSIFPKIVLLIYYGLILFSIFLYRKEKAVLFLLSLFSVEILVNVVVGYGINEAQIFASHWVFILPLLIGWLYRKAINTKWVIGLNVVILFLIISFACINIPHLEIFGK